MTTEKVVLPNSCVAEANSESIDKELSVSFALARHARLVRLVTKYPVARGETAITRKYLAQMKQHVITRELGGRDCNCIALDGKLARAKHGNSEGDRSQKKAVTPISF
jgi:hypothetical protein